MAGIRRVIASMSAIVCSASACAFTPGVFVTVTPRARQAVRSTLSVPAPQIEMRRSAGQAASTRSVKRACARMLTITCASPTRSINVGSWSAPRSVNTRTWPSFFNGASATEPVSAGGKSSGTTIFTVSFGIGLVLVCLVGKVGVLWESAGVEEREVHRRLPIHDPFGDHTAGHGRMLEAVAAEADGEKESLDAGRGSDDGVIIRSERAQPRPAAGNLGALDDGQPMHRVRHGSSTLPQSIGTI